MVRDDKVLGSYVILPTNQQKSKERQTKQKNSPDPFGETLRYLRMHSYLICIYVT